MKCRKCNLAERHGELAYCLPCNAAYLKEYRERKKVKMEEPIKEREDWVKKQGEDVIKLIDKVQGRQSGVDRLYIHTGPNPKIKRCQAGKDGGACQNEGMPATVGEYKAWLCFAHSSMGKLVDA